MRSGIYHEISHAEVLEYETESLPIIEKRLLVHAKQRHCQRWIGQIALRLYRQPLRRTFLRHPSGNFLHEVQALEQIQIGCKCRRSHKGLIAAGYLRAGQRLEEFFSPDGPTMLPIIDGMQDWIIAHRKELDPTAFHRFAMTTLRESRNKECVKFALSLLELLDSQPEDRQVILTLALSDEFTLFCMYVIRGWEDGNDQMFRLAKQVHGWGRIFLVHELEPDTPEIRDWLLREGWRNDILPNYSAALCAKKGQLRELLSRSFLPPDQRDAVRDLVEALLVESPLPGISGLEDGEGLLREYLRHAGGMVLDEEDRRVVKAVEGNLEKKTPAGEK